ncbi:MAG: S8 family serine peptidase, partial [Pseudanabaena sp. ELA645]
NGIGIDGVNDNAPIWLGRAVGSGEWANSLTDFVNHSVASGHDNAVVNLSMDLTQVDANGIVTPRYEFTPQERAALELARQNGVLIVVAAGNDGGIMSVLGQASQEFDNIITVGAADGLGRADYSNYGYGLDILADGGTIADPILSTVGDGVGTMAGTSVATAEVTGAISQIWAANPDLSYRQVIDIVKQSATDLDTVGWDMQTGAGLLNLAGAITLATATKGEVYNPLSFSIPTTWVGAGLVTPKERAAESIYGSFGTAYYLGNLNDGYTSHTVVGYVDGSDPEVYYKFYLSSNSDLKLELTNLSADADVELYDSNQNRIAYGAQSGTSNESISTSLNAGNYFVRVYSFGGNTTGYDLRLTPTSTSPGESLDNTVGYDGGSTHQTYINTFNRNGGSSSLGSPTNNVHRWEGGYIQDFSGGYDARGGIMKSNANDMSYWVGGEFWTRFLAAGDARVLGYPTSDSYQITKSNGDVYKKQDFQNGSIEFFVRSGTGNGGGNDPVYPPTNPTAVTINGYTVGGNFYPVFQNYQGTLGNPISGVQYNSNTGASYQLFSSGFIVSSGYGTFPIYGAIREAYLKAGGLNGFLGAPATPEVGQGNGVIIQRFYGGYIIWNGVKATAYQYGSGPNPNLSNGIGTVVLVDETGGLPSKFFGSKTRKLSKGAISITIKDKNSLRERGFKPSDIKAIEGAITNWQAIITKDYDDNAQHNFEIAFSFLKNPDPSVGSINWKNQDGKYFLAYAGTNDSDTGSREPGHINFKAGVRLTIPLVMHEIGHILGLNHTSTGLMNFNANTMTLSAQSYQELSEQGYTFDKKWLL